jgi:hypothetical protein
MNPDTSFMNPTSFDRSFSIGEIMEQRSVTALDVGSSELNASGNNSAISHSAEQSSRYFMVSALPKTTAAYVFV